MKSRDLDLVLDAWAAPAPTVGFADRVMIACAAPKAVVQPARAESSWRSLLAAAAMIAAVVGVPIYVAQNAAPPVMAAAPMADLGPLQD
jgi:hypothetical protein